MSMQTPTRTRTHDDLAVFLGDWHAVGTSYAGTDQTGADPRAGGVPWESTQTAHWHPGEFYLVQDERAVVGGVRFETLAVLGVDESGTAFTRTFDNLGFSNRYDLTHDHATWWITGPSERATIVLSEDARVQTITWEWKPEDTWLPLCDQVATRVD